MKNLLIAVVERLYREQKEVMENDDNHKVKREVINQCCAIFRSCVNSPDYR